MNTKKAISLILVFVLCLSLCSCGKSKAVKNVENLINTIGQVTADSEASVVAAEKAYSELTEKEKEAVGNFSVLTEARSALETALREKQLKDLYAAVSCEWVNVNDMDRYVFNLDGTGTHDEKTVKFTIDPDNKILSVTEGATSSATTEFTIDLENNPPRLTPKNAATYYVEAENYEAIAKEIRDEYTDILTSYEYWSNTRGLNYIMFGESGAGFFLLSGTTLGMEWEWVDNNTIKATFEYSGTKYSNILTIINTTDGPRLVNDQNVIQFVPRNKLK